MKYSLLIIGAIVFSGCSSKLETMKKYEFNDIKVNKKHSSKYKNKILKVSYPDSINGRYDENIKYTYVGQRSGTYLNSKWKDDLGKMLEGYLIENLDESKIFKDVISNNSRINEDYNLETSIFEFSNHIINGKSYSIVSIKFSLVDANTGELIKSKRFSYREEAKTMDADGYVEATNRIINRMINNLILWI